MNKYPPELKWSSFGYYAFGEPNDLITPDPIYLAMGETNQERQRKFLELVDFVLAHDSNTVPREDLVLSISGPYYVAKRFEEITGQGFTSGLRIDAIPEIEFDLDLSQNQTH